MMCIRADFMCIYAYFICIYLGVVVQINSSQILSGPCVSSSNCSASDWRLCKCAGREGYPSEWPGNPAPLETIAKFNPSESP